MKKSMIILATCLMTSVTFLAQGQTVQNGSVAKEGVQNNGTQTEDTEFAPKQGASARFFRENRPEHRMLAAGQQGSRPRRMEMEENRPERTRPETDSPRSALRDDRDARPAERYLAMRHSFRRPGPVAGADRIRPETFEKPERQARPERPGIENLNNSDASEGMSNTEARRRRPIIGVLEGKDVSSMLKGSTIELSVLDIRSSLLS